MTDVKRMQALLCTDDKVDRVFYVRSLEDEGEAIVLTHARKASAKSTVVATAPRG